MAIFLFESGNLRKRFYPLTRNKSVANLQLGGCELVKWWEQYNEEPVYILTEDFLQLSVPRFLKPGDTLIHAGFLPVPLDRLCKAYRSAFDGICLPFSGKKQVEDSEIVLIKVQKTQPTKKVRDCLFNMPGTNAALAALLTTPPFKWQKGKKSDLIQTPEGLLKWQVKGIQMTVEQKLTADTQQGRNLQPLDKSNQQMGIYPVHIEAGANALMALFDTSAGPIYIEKNAQIMAGAMLKGPVFIGEGSVIKMGARIYGPVVSGSNCVLGGEIKNVLFHEGTNKGHDGYLGDSIVGAWCNFGAGSGGSNLKNTAGAVKLYDYAVENYRNVGQKFGALVGDFTRIGVGTQLTTGSSIGFCCQLSGAQIPPSLVRDFSWRTGDKIEPYQLDKAIKHIDNWRKLKSGRLSLSEREIQILRHIFDQTGDRPKQTGR